MKQLRVYFLIAFLLTGGPAVLGADETVEQELAALKGKEKADLLATEAQSNLYKNPALSFKYATDLLHYSRSIGYTGGEADALLNISSYYAIKGDFKKAMANARHALKILKKNADQRRLSDCLNTIAIVYMLTGNYKKSLEFHKQSLALRESLGDKKRTSVSLDNMGLLYSRMGNFDRAVEYHLKAVALKDKSTGKFGIARSYHNIGIIYAKMDNLESALEYFKRSLKIKKEIGDMSGIASSTQAMGICYMDLKKYRKSLEYLLESLALYRKMKHTTGVIMTLQNMGNTYLDLDQPQKSIDALTEAMQLAEQLEMPPGEIAGIIITLGRVYKRQGKYKEAMGAFKKGVELLKSTGDKETLMNGCWNLYDLYKTMGQWKKALFYFEKTSKLRTRIFNENTGHRINELQAKHNELEHQKKNLLLRLKNRDQELLLEREANQKYLLVILIIMLLLLFILFFLRYRYLFTFWKKRNYIAHYRLLGKIGSGGMGEIYRARDIRGKKDSTCAIKVLKEEYYEDEKYRQRFKSEAALVDQLQHPNIVSVIERGEHDGNLYIAMELLQGKTLADFMETCDRDNFIPLLSIMIQTADALVEIHKRGIIHRDLKPENIMVIDEPGTVRQVKILDFGLARPRNLSRLTRTGTIMGTIHYIAPEQLTLSKVLSAGDVYSLGIIFYQILTGKKPFDGDSAFTIARQILKDTQIHVNDFPPGIPADLPLMITRMTAKDPDNRPSAPGVFQTLKEIEESGFPHQQQSQNAQPPDLVSISNRNR